MEVSGLFSMSSAKMWRRSHFVFFALLLCDLLITAYSVFVSDVQAHLARAEAVDAFEQFSQGMVAVADHIQTAVKGASDEHAAFQNDLFAGWRDLNCSGAQDGIKVSVIVLVEGGLCQGVEFVLALAGLVPGQASDTAGFAQGDTGDDDLGGAVK